MNTVMTLRDPQKRGNSKDQRLKKDLVRKSRNLVEFHHYVFNYSTDPDGNSPSCSTPRNNVSWADNRQDILQSDSLDDDKTSYDYSLPAPCIFKLMQVVPTSFCIMLLKILMKYPIFWNFTQGRMAVPYRRFGTPIGPIFKGQAVQEDLTLEGGIDRLSRNVGKKVPFYMHKHSKVSVVRAKL